MASSDELLDRAEVDRAYSSMPHRSLESWDNEALRLVVGQGWLSDLVAMTISADPVAYADKAFRRTTVCPICGADTDANARLPASVHPVYDVGGVRKSPVMFGVWVHSKCFDDCPATNQPTPIPW